MNILEIDEKKAYFIIEDEKVEPEKISRDDLFKILNLVYENHSEIVFPDEDGLKSVINQVEKEIVEQIIAKIKEFHTNVPEIKMDINSKFPDLNT